MYHRWLNRYDERRACRSDDLKEEAALTIGAGLAFPGASDADDLTMFHRHADQAVADPAFFAEDDNSDLNHVWENSCIRFRSSVSTGIEKNDIVWVKVTERRPSDHALVIFHHWNASSRYPQIANFFSWRGITAVEIAMPYHFERRRPDAKHADYMLSQNLGRTVQSMRQAVLDGRKLIRILRSEGYRRISVLGMSLGSWVAGLISAHDPTVGKAALFLTAGSLADMVWTGRATRHIRASLEDEIALIDLRRAWAPLDLENYADKLARPGLDLMIVLAKRDTVVLPELSKGLIANLRSAGIVPSVLELNCGHYSLSLPPYILRAGLQTSRLLTRDRS